MYTELLRSIGGIDIFPVISLVLFVVVFTVMLVRVLRMDRAQASEMAALPLDEVKR
jgi:cytochrome c oxidase cbb3-type subunit 4